MIAERKASEIVFGNVSPVEIALSPNDKIADLVVVTELKTAEPTFGFGSGIKGEIGIRPENIEEFWVPCSPADIGAEVEPGPAWRRRWWRRLKQHVGCGSRPRRKYAEREDTGRR